MKAKSTRTSERKKTRHMGDEAFADLKEALEGALAFERGERRDLHVTRIPLRILRKKNHLRFGKRRALTRWRDCGARACLDVARCY